MRSNSVVTKVLTALFLSSILAQSAFAGNYPGDIPEKGIFAAGSPKIDQKATYVYHGDSYSAQFWDPTMGRGGARIQVDIEKGAHFSGEKIARYVKYNVMSTQAPLAKLAIVGLVVGIAAGVTPQVEASTVRLKSSDGAPLSANIETNVGESKNSFESYAGAAPVAAGKTAK